MEDPIRRARRHEAAGEIDQALAAYREVTPDQPGFSEARIRIVGILLMRGRPDEAEREARAFVEAKPQRPEAYATLGQMLRLSFRHDEAIESFRKALALSPGSAGYRGLLNDARRARYWSPDPDLRRGLLAHVAGGTADAASEYRLFHLELLARLSPRLQQWVMSGAADGVLPDSLRGSLDPDSLRSARRILQEPGSPYAPARGRVTLADGSTREGLIEDGDGTIGAALEAVERDDYAILPFGGIETIEFLEPGSYVRTRLVPRSAPAREVEMPATYFFTEGSRRMDLREGRRTVWRTLADGLRIGLGLRAFALDSATIRLDRVRKIEFL